MKYAMPIDPVTGVVTPAADRAGAGGEERSLSGG